MQLKTFILECPRFIHVVLIFLLSTSRLNNSLIQNKPNHHHTIIRHCVVRIHQNLHTIDFPWNPNHTNGINIKSFSTTDPTRSQAIIEIYVDLFQKNMEIIWCKSHNIHKTKNILELVHRNFNVLLVQWAKAIYMYQYWIRNEMHQPLWCWRWNILCELGQNYGCGSLGYLLCPDISNHDTDDVKWECSCLPWEWISATCVVTELRNYMNSIHIWVS